LLTVANRDSDSNNRLDDTLSVKSVPIFIQYVGNMMLCLIS